MSETIETRIKLCGTMSSHKPRITSKDREQDEPGKWGIKEPILIIIDEEAEKGPGGTSDQEKFWSTVNIIKSIFIISFGFPSDDGDSPTKKGKGKELGPENDRQLETRGEKSSIKISSGNAQGEVTDKDDWIVKIFPVIFFQLLL